MEFLIVEENNLLIGGSQVLLQCLYLLVDRVKVLINTTVYLSWLIVYLNVAHSRINLFNTPLDYKCRFLYRIDLLEALNLLILIIQNPLF